MDVSHVIYMLRTEESRLLKLKVKVKLWNDLSTLVQKRTAYRGTHVGLLI